MGKKKKKQRHRQGQEDVGNGSVGDSLGERRQANRSTRKQPDALFSKPNSSAPAAASPPPCVLCSDPLSRARFAPVIQPFLPIVCVSPATVHFDWHARQAPFLADDDCLPGAHYNRRPGNSSSSSSSSDSDDTHASTSSAAGDDSLPWISSLDALVPAVRLAFFGARRREQDLSARFVVMVRRMVRANVARGVAGKSDNADVVVAETAAAEDESLVCATFAVKLRRLKAKHESCQSAFHRDAVDRDVVHRRRVIRAPSARAASARRPLPEPGTDDQASRYRAWRLVADYLVGSLVPGCSSSTGAVNGPEIRALGLGNRTLCALTLSCRRRRQLLGMDQARRRAALGPLPDGCAFVPLMSARSTDAEFVLRSALNCATDEEAQVEHRFQMLSPCLLELAAIDSVQGQGDASPVPVRGKGDTGTHVPRLQVVDVGPRAVGCEVQFQPQKAAVDSGGSAPQTTGAGSTASLVAAAESATSLVYCAHNHAEEFLSCRAQTSLLRAVALWPRVKRLLVFIRVCDSVGFEFVSAAEELLTPALDRAGIREARVQLVDGSTGGGVRSGLSWLHQHY